MKKSTYVVLIILFFFLLAAVGAFFVVVEDLGGRAVDVPARGYLEVTLSGAVVEVAPPDALLVFSDRGEAPDRPRLLDELPQGQGRRPGPGRPPPSQPPRVRLGQGDRDCGTPSSTSAGPARRSTPISKRRPISTWSTIVATACDKIILHPLGWLGVNGIGGYVPFFKGTLDKLGVRAEFEHVEEYKTAYNMFTEKGFTPAHREEMESIYSDIFAQYVRTAAKARGKTEAEFRALIDQASSRASRPSAAGLVDDCLYEDELQGLLGRDGRSLAPDQLRRLHPG